MSEKNKLYDEYAKFQHKINKNIITFGFYGICHTFSIICCSFFCHQYRST